MQGNKVEECYFLGFYLDIKKENECSRTPSTLKMQQSFRMEKAKFLYLPHTLIYLYTLHITIRPTGKFWHILLLHGFVHFQKNLIQYIYWIFFYVQTFDFLTLWIQFDHSVNKCKHFRIHFYAFSWKGNIHCGIGFVYYFQNPVYIFAEYCFTYRLFNNMNISQPSGKKCTYTFSHVRVFLRIFLKREHNGWHLFKGTQAWEIF